MSWRRFCKTSWRRLENVLKTSWRRIAKTNILVLTKTSWRRKVKANIFVLIKTSSEDENERCLQDLFIKTNVCWGGLITTNIPCKDLLRHNRFYHATSNLSSEDFSRTLFCSFVCTMLGILIVSKWGRRAGMGSILFCFLLLCDPSIDLQDNFPTSVLSRFVRHSEVLGFEEKKHVNFLETDQFFKLH